MNYWQLRAQENRELTDLIESNSFVRLNLILKNNLKDIEKEIDQFDLSFINEDLTAKEIKDLKDKLKKAANYNEKDAYLKKLYNEQAKLYKLNRLEGLRTTLQIRLSEMTNSQQNEVLNTLIKTGSSAYKFAKETFEKKYNIDLSGVSNSTLKTLANETWIGKKNWSSRIWKDREKLGSVLDKTLKDGITRGYPLDRIARDIKGRFQTSTYNAMRLVRTETTHVHQQALKKIYEDTGTEKYIYMALIDGKTSTICRELNNKKFKLKDAQTGVNFPPMHPNCRSTTAPIPDEKALLKKYGVSEEAEKKTKTQEAEAPQKAKTKAKEPMKINLSIVDPFLNESEKSELTTILQKAPENVQTAWNNYISDCAILDFNSNRTPHFNPYKKGVFLSSNSVLRDRFSSVKGEKEVAQKRFGVLFHELGHNISYLHAKKVTGLSFDIDSGSQYFSKKYVFQTYENGEKVKKGYSLTKMVKEEVDQYVDLVYNKLKDEAVKNGLKRSSVLKSQAYLEISKEIKALPMLSQSDISDMFEGATRGSARGYFGHGKNYWKEHEVGVEAFAEMFDATINNPQSLEQIKKYFPKSYEVFIEIIDQMGVKNVK